VYHTIGTSLRWLLDTKTLAGQIRSLLSGVTFICRIQPYCAFVCLYMIAYILIQPYCVFIYDRL